MIPYRLLLVSWRKPDSLGDSYNSNQMLGWGLWTEFSRLSHVELLYHDSESPLPEIEPVDFALLHCYVGAPIFSEMAKLRAMVRNEVVSFSVLSFSESPCPAADHSFTFLPYSGTTHVPCPCLVDPFAAPSSPVPGSILLDHVWLPDYGTHRDLCPQLYEWLGPSPDRVIGQLQRGGHESAEKFLPWIKVVPESNYYSYLAHTSAYETFILTHPGSYEHSIVDMVARGIRVLVPVQGGKTFAPRPLVEWLSLETFSGRDELMTLLASPYDDAIRRRELCTSMREVAKTIDARCQSVLPPFRMAYEGLTAQQNPDVENTFRELFRRTAPSRILEIGTGGGGLTLLLRGLVPHVRSYDIVERAGYDRLRKAGVDLRIDDIFRPDRAFLFACAVDFIQRSGRTVVLCDGGNKVDEFRALAPHLKRGDIIMAHDYAATDEVFAAEIKGRTWDWCEITFPAIADVCRACNLEPILEDRFARMAWCCFQKC